MVDPNGHTIAYFCPIVKVFEWGFGGEPFCKKVSPIKVPKNSNNNFFHGVKVIRSGLVNEIVEPVGEEEMGMASPMVDGHLLGIVVGEIVLGNGNIQPLGNIAEVFGSKSARVVLAVTGHIKEAALLGAYNVNAGFIGLGKDLDLVALFDVLTANLRMSGVRRHKVFVKAAQNLPRNILLQRL